MLLQPFVENSINHGLYHKKGTEGKLLIKAISTGNNVTIIIKDNGVGRGRAKEIRENSLKKHRSRATEIIQERLLVLKKEKNIDIDIAYNDLYDSEGAAEGTEVLITMPKILRGYD
jgi:LytS/YehU family sensor histidine kinase